MNCVVSLNAQVVAKEPILKKNSISLSFNSTFGYGVNSFIVGENQTKKRGYLFQAEYFRNLHKRIAIGISFGHSNGKDRNNPDLEILDFEIVKYMHLNIYPFIINNKSNRLYVKGSIGLTNTDRLNSTFNITPWNEERGLYYSNITDWNGFTIEVRYDRSFSNNFFLGLNLGIVSHNDGANFAGASLSYVFK